MPIEITKFVNPFCRTGTVKVGIQVIKRHGKTYTRIVKDKK